MKSLGYSLVVQHIEAAARSLGGVSWSCHWGWWRPFDFFFTLDNYFFLRNDKYGQEMKISSKCPTSAIASPHVKYVKGCQLKSQWVWQNIVPQAIFCWWTWEFTWWLLTGNKSNFLRKLIKNQIEWHHSWCHGDNSVQCKVVDAWRRVRNKNCHQDTIARNTRPKFTQQILFRTLFMEIAKHFEFWEPLVWKLPKCVVKKHASTLGIAMVTKGGRTQIKKYFCLENEFI